MALKTPLKSEYVIGRRLMRFVAGAACLAFVVGCHQLNDPWKDSSASIDAEMTTASAEGFKGKTEFYVPLHRRGEMTTAYYENGTVTHFPLWFEDPFEDKGNDVNDPNDIDAPDNRFVVNLVDYAHMAAGPGRAFFVNGVFWPASAIVTHPGKLLESDGRVSKGVFWYDHDAKPSDPYTREAPDQHHLSGAAPADAGESMESTTTESETSAN